MKFETKCEECYGSGRIDTEIQICTRYRGDCCGGCTETIDCPDCDGSGTIEIDTDEYLEDELCQITEAVSDIYVKLRSHGICETEISEYLDKKIRTIKK